jgi:hypothetical protein
MNTSEPVGYGPPESCYPECPSIPSGDWEDCTCLAAGSDEGTEHTLDSFETSNGKWPARCSCGWYMSISLPDEQAATEFVQQKHLDRVDYVQAACAVSMYALGKTLVFTSGNRYRITAVEDGQVTFCHPSDPEDSTTETIEDLDAVDVRVLGVAW